MVPAAALLLSPSNFAPSPNFSPSSSQSALRAQQPRYVSFSRTMGVGHMYVRTSPRAHRVSNLRLLALSARDRSKRRTSERAGMPREGGGVRKPMGAVWNSGPLLPNQRFWRKRGLLLKLHATCLSPRTVPSSSNTHTQLRRRSDVSWSRAQIEAGSRPTSGRGSEVTPIVSFLTAVPVCTRGCLRMRGMRFVTPECCRASTLYLSVRPCVPRSKSCAKSDFVRSAARARVVNLRERYGACAF